MTSIITSFFQAFEELSIPRQESSIDDFKSYQNYPNLNLSGTSFRRHRSEITFTPYGVYKAIDRINIPPVDSSDSLVSLSSHYSMESLTDEQSPSHSSSKVTTTSMNLVFKAMEDLSLGTYSSSSSLSTMGTQSPMKSQVDEDNHTNKSIIISYLQFFIQTLEEFLEQTGGL